MSVQDIKDRLRWSDRCWSLDDVIGCDERYGMEWRKMTGVGILVDTDKVWGKRQGMRWFKCNSNSNSNVLVCEIPNRSIMVCIVLGPHFITFHLISTITTRAGNGVPKMRGSLLHYPHRDLHSPGHVAQVPENIVSRHTDIHTTHIFSSSTLPHLIKCVSTWYLGLHDWGGLSVVRQSTTIRLHRYRVRPCLRAEYTRTVMTSIRGGWLSSLSSWLVPLEFRVRTGQIWHQP
jgi:hypothetical protein